ncbi:hypothetical protein I316_04847 [Kwoniella heveanensis BCC8398]|uniref:Uncharacterized protein n=1 Tax=Kwoniella heveanensis BCC8398 TaxID=1296120 RepID=A0A1B9GQZ8_9TREE|nr:hypothetical protein I316_04847 [Kwoniella heveanensis BCC8398]
MPLTTEASINSQFTFPPAHSRTSSKSKAKEVDGEDVPAAVKTMSGHRHRRSDSQAHRRQRSSIVVPAGASFGQGLSRPSVMGVFDLEPPREIITTPASPLVDPPALPSGPTIEPDENHEEVAARLSTFSFGSKPPASTFPPKRRQHPLVPSQSLFTSELAPSTSPLGSPSAKSPNCLNHLSTPLSRPPSVLLTRPTPLPFGSPTSSAPSRASLASSPSSPPTPARKRHSHTRSNSISLPNLKLGGPRPTSLGVPTSPSFPSSPCSPTSAGNGPARSRLSGPINGQRLKFEPSGRGAEAEKEREESRRKALEKLTGGPSPRPAVAEPNVAEISLPDLDDEDTSSVASSNRPLSGAFGSGSGSNFFSRPSSLTLPPLTGSSNSTPSTLSASPFSWSSPSDDRSPVERWSGYSFGLQKEFAKEEAAINVGFGMDLGTAMAKRPSINRQLSALAEVDESEEGEADFEDDEVSPCMTRTLSDDPENVASLPFVPAVEPTPSRLRELRLPSSVSSSTPRQSEGSTDSIHSFSFPRHSSASPSLGSPTKAYGSIGRGRPKPLPLGSSVSSTPTSMSTPRSAGLSSRRRGPPGSGSRGSSISYKRDDSSSSSRDMSTGRVASPTLISPPPSMSLSSSAFGSWGNIPRGIQRPCPRPRQLIGLGIDNSASGRVLNEVDEGDEDDLALVRSARWMSPPPDADADIPRQYPGFGPTSEPEPEGRPSQELDEDEYADEEQWRDVQLEMEMEREALKEDVELWRARCKSLEDKLEAERKEGAVLRDRVRKLGDRLSSVSSVPVERTPAPADTHMNESRLIAEMREQLFTLTTSLESERRAKEEALLQLSKFQLHGQQSVPVLSGHASSAYEEFEEDELLLTARPDLTDSFSVRSPIVQASMSPASRAAEPEPMHQGYPVSGSDPNLARMKGWGFPKDPSPSKYSNELSKKRESFFGLSNPLRRTTSADGAEEHNGVDLPPFVFPPATTGDQSNIDKNASTVHGYPMLPSAFMASQANEFGARAVSDPVHPVKKTVNNHVPLESPSLYDSDTAPPAAPRANVATPAPGSGSITSSAISFFSGYLRSTEEEQRPSFSPVSVPAVYTPRYIAKEEQKVPVGCNVGKLDFRAGCRCCVGPVIEV